MATHYSVLNCDPDASYEALKQSYQKLIKLHHPDKQTDRSATACGDFLRIDEAWKVLRDDETRKQYDAELLQNKFNEKPLIYSSLTTEDLDYDKDTDCFSYVCRCGGKYSIDKQTVQSIENDCLVECDECSLVILIKRNNKIQ